MVEGSDGSRGVAAPFLDGGYGVAVVSTDMTRCIHCTRCVRFGQEIAGLRELGATGRGEHTKIGTYVAHAMNSELSGNVIDLCPVGALTSKPFRFKARAWELNQTAAIAPHDSVGSNIYVHARRGQVMRVVPREFEEVNEVWLSDRDRFSYEGLYHEDRVTAPMVKINGEDTVNGLHVYTLQWSIPGVGVQDFQAYDWNGRALLVPEAPILSRIEPEPEPVAQPVGSDASRVRHLGHRFGIPGLGLREVEVGEDRSQRVTDLVGQPQILSDPAVPVLDAPVLAPGRRDRSEERFSRNAETGEASRMPSSA